VSLVVANRPSGLSPDDLDGVLRAPDLSWRTPVDVIVEGRVMAVTQVQVAFDGTLQLIVEVPS
jgi:hypothetical protein